MCSRSAYRDRANCAEKFATFGAFVAQRRRTMLDRIRRTSKIRSFANTYIGAANSMLRGFVPIAVVLSSGCMADEPEYGESEWNTRG